MGSNRCCRVTSACLRNVQGSFTMHQEPLDNARAKAMVCYGGGNQTMRASGN